MKNEMNESVARSIIWHIIVEFRKHCLRNLE